MLDQLNTFKLLSSFAQPSRPGWVIPGAKADFNFAKNRLFVSPSRVSSDPASFAGWSYSRTGTRFSEASDGSLTSFAANVPRITDKGLAVHSGATNIIARSSDIAGWSKIDCTVTDDAIASIISGQLADKIVEGSGTVRPEVSTTAGVTTGNPYNYSGYFKAAERDTLQLNYSGLIMGAFDLVAETATAGAGDAFFTNKVATITALADGWYRCDVQADCIQTIAGNPRIYINQGIGSPASYSGDGVSGLYADGVQITATSTVVPLIPTAASTASAGADAAALDLGLSGGLWTNVGNLDPSNGFWVYAEFEAEDRGTGGNAGGIVSFTDDPLSAEWLAPHISRGTTDVRIFQRAGGVSATTLLADSISGKYGTAIKLAVQYNGSTSFKSSIDGAAVDSGTAIAGMAVEQIIFGDFGANPDSLEGYVRRIVIGEGTLTDAQLQALST